MNEEEYREKGRRMTLDFLEGADMLIRVHGTFNGSDVSINEYHDPAEVDFHFESRHNFQYEFVTNKEAALSEL